MGSIPTAPPRPSSPTCPMSNGFCEPAWIIAAWSTAFAPADATPIPAECLSASPAVFSAAPRSVVATGARVNTRSAIAPGAKPIRAASPVPTSEPRANFSCGDSPAVAGSLFKAWMCAPAMEGWKDAPAPIAAPPAPPSKARPARPPAIATGMADKPPPTLPAAQRPKSPTPCTCSRLATSGATF